MSTITGLSFYDSLNKLTIGWLIILPLVSDAIVAFQNPLAYVVAFLIGTIYQCGVQYLTKPIRNALFMIRNQNNYVPEDKKKDITADDYYKAYYKVATTGILMNIPVLEAIENFIRNIIPIAIIYIVALVSNCQAMEKLIEGIGNSCYCAITLTVIVILLFPTWYHVQNKIYELVWEGMYYNDKLNR